MVERLRDRYRGERDNMTWICVILILMAIIIIINNHRLNKFEDRLKEVEQKNKAQSDWLLFLLNRRYQHDDQRPQSIPDSEEGR